MSHTKKQIREHIVVDHKKLEKLRKSLTKTIDDFKRTVLESLEAPEDGPLKERLRPIDDVVERAPQLSTAIPIVTQQTGIISAEALEQWVSQQDKPVSSLPAEGGADAPYADVGLSLEQLKLKAKTFKPVEDVGYAPYADVGPTPAPKAVEPMLKPTEETNYTPYADVAVKAQLPLHGGGAQVFFAGFDNLVNSNVRNFLQRLGVRTFLPVLEGHGHKPILEQFQLYNDIEFAIVVLSPDEYMFQKMQDPKNALLVAAQKTIYELGFLVGKLGRNRVAVFYEDIDKFKRPTEYFDISYIPFDTAGQWQQQLIKQMRIGGIVFNEAKVLAL